MKKITLFTFIVLTTISLFLVACQPAAQDAAPSEPEAPAEEAAEPAPTITTILEEEMSDFDTPEGVVFDPARGLKRENVGLVYETLLKVGENGILVPMLALGATVSDDGLDYIIDLRPGVKFHDGSTLNADVVIANFDRWYDPANAFGAWFVEFGGFKGDVDEEGKPASKYDGIEKVDDLTVLIHLNEPDATFLNKLAYSNFAIISLDAVENPDFGTEAGGDGGSGPYMISAWNENGLSLEPYADYWNPNAVPTEDKNISFK